MEPNISPSKATIVTEKQLTSSYLNHEVPKIWGNFVVYMVYLNDTGYPNDYILNLTSLKERPLNSSKNWQEIGDISDKYVVWQENHGTSDLNIYDISTGKNSRIKTSGSYSSSPSISGNLIAYLGRVNDHDEVFYYDISTSTETQITISDSVHVSPKIYGDVIAYSAINPNARLSDVYVYNVTTRVTTRLTYDGSSGTLQVYDGKVLYGVYDKNNNDELFLRDLSTNQTIKVDSKMSSHGGVCFYGDLIVYVGYNGSNSGLYTYSISSTKESLLTDRAAVNPAIYENRIVWQGSRNGCDEIYMAEFFTVKPVTHPSEPINLGLAVVVMLIVSAVMVILLWNARKQMRARHS